MISVYYTQHLPKNPYIEDHCFFGLQKNLSMEKSLDLYNISKRTYNRILKEENSEITTRKYAIEVKKERITQKQKEEITRILDDILPKQSGRDYKYQETTNNKFYDIYHGEVINGDPVSKSFFLYSIMSKEKVSHSKTRKFCPLCEELENGEVTEKLLRHKEFLFREKNIKHKNKILEMELHQQQH